ncbi:restriction endonuclease subunit S [Parabacteroides merdae]|nr:restriction endonuclease subunit S [Parabacteroides merdae]MDB8983874.1 restriction endonuclease subunit S [Parabacteroides merdae]MDB9121194.1 restriction endonuclease subunit S [Parabacteroides merdae]
MDTKTLRQKILDLAIHGKLVPQDPNDEPASVLLERIKVEKERLIKEGKIKRSKKSAKTSDTPHYENVPFEVPESWVWTNIEELFFVTKLAGFEYTDYFTKDTISSNNEVPIVRAQNVRMGYFVENTNEAISEALSQQLERSALTKECLLMTFIGAGIGDTCIFPALKRCHLAPNVAKIEPYSNKIDLKYGLYYLMSDLGQLGVRGISKSTAQPSLSMATIRSLDVALPPLTEQYRIVAEIEKWFELIDQIEQGKSDLQTTIKQTKSKILDLAIHGKLVPQDPNDEPAIELLKRISPDFTPCDNGHYTQLPQSWSLAPMQTLCSLVDGERQSGIERIYLDVKYLRGERDTKTLIYGKYVSTNSLLILVDGENSGEVFRTPIEGYQGSTFKQLSISDNMNTEYVLQVINLHRKTLRENKVGSAIPHLNKKLFKAIKVPIPPYNEQRRIVEAVNLAFKQLDVITESL